MQDEQVDGDFQIIDDRPVAATQSASAPEIEQEGQAMLEGAEGDALPKLEKRVSEAITTNPGVFDSIRLPNFRTGSQQPESVTTSQRVNSNISS